MEPVGKPFANLGARRLPVLVAWGLTAACSLLSAGPGGAQGTDPKLWVTNGTVKAVTGAATTWNPDADDRVSALAVSGGTVYISGYFTSIGGQARNNIAALDATSGAATAWNPNSVGPVYALALSG